MDEAQRKMESYLSTASLMQINEEKYTLIRDGIPVMVKKPNGQSEEKKAQIVDFQNPTDQSRNHFLVIKELKIHGEYYQRRTDIVGFVNGIPLLFVELKKNTMDVQNAYDDNYTDYLDTILHLFHYNAFFLKVKEIRSSLIAMLRMQLVVFLKFYLMELIGKHTMFLMKIKELHLLAMLSL